jgi:hypothetical protein
VHQGGVACFVEELVLDLESIDSEMATVVHMSGAGVKTSGTTDRGSGRGSYLERMEEEEEAPTCAEGRSRATEDEVPTGAGWRPRAEKLALRSAAGRPRVAEEEAPRSVARRAPMVVSPSR